MCSKDAVCTSALSSCNAVFCIPNAVFPLFLHVYPHLYPSNLRTISLGQNQHLFCVHEVNQQFKDLSPHNREHFPWLEVKLPTIKTLWVPGLPGCVFQLCVRNSHPSRWCGAAGSKHTAQRQSDPALKCNKRAKRVKLEFKVLHLRNCSQVQEALLSCWRPEEGLTSHLCF